MIPYSTPRPPSINERVLYDPGAVFSEVLEQFSNRDQRVRHTVACLASCAITTIQKELTGEQVVWQEFVVQEATKNGVGDITIPEPYSWEDRWTLEECVSSLRAKRGIKITERSMLQGFLDGTVTIVDRR